jgi:hypothetical protein
VNIRLLGAHSLLIVPLHHLSPDGSERTAAGQSISRGHGTAKVPLSEVLSRCATPQISVGWQAGKVPMCVPARGMFSHMCYPAFARKLAQTRVPWGEQLHGGTQLDVLRRISSSGLSSA